MLLFLTTLAALFVSCSAGWFPWFAEDEQFGPQMSMVTRKVRIKRGSGFLVAHESASEVEQAQERNLAAKDPEGGDQLAGSPPNATGGFQLMMQKDLNGAMLGRPGKNPPFPLFWLKTHCPLQWRFFYSVAAIRMLLHGLIGGRVPTSQLFVCSAFWASLPHTFARQHISKPRFVSILRKVFFSFPGSLQSEKLARDDYTDNFLEPTNSYKAARVVVLEQSQAFSGSSA